MSNHKESHTEHKLRNVAKTVSELPETQNIKENVVGLAHKLQEASSDAAEYASQYAQDQVRQLKSASQEAIKDVEKQIKSNPYQSTFLAFMAGAALSYLFGRRS